VEDTAEYVRYRLAAAGTDRALFPDDALTALHELSQGALREIDRLAIAALREAARRKKKLVDRETIQRVAEPSLVSTDLSPPVARPQGCAAARDITSALPPVRPDAHHPRRNTRAGTMPIGHSANIPIIQLARAHTRADPTRRDPRFTLLREHTLSRGRRT